MDRYIAIQNHQQSIERSQLRANKLKKFDDLTVLGVTSVSKEQSQDSRPRSRLRKHHNSKNRLKGAKHLSKTVKEDLKKRKVPHLHDNFSTGMGKGRIDKINQSMKNYNNESLNPHINQMQNLSSGFNSSKKGPNVFSQPEKVKFGSLPRNQRPSDLAKISRQWMNKNIKSAQKRRYEDIKSLYNSLTRSRRRDQYGLLDFTNRKSPDGVNPSHSPIKKRLEKPLNMHHKDYLKQITSALKKSKKKGQYKKNKTVDQISIERRKLKQLKNLSQNSVLQRQYARKRKKKWALKELRDTSVTNKTNLQGEISLQQIQNPLVKEQQEDLDTIKNNAKYGGDFVVVGHRQFSNIPNKDQPNVEIMETSMSKISKSSKHSKATHRSKKGVLRAGPNYNKQGTIKGSKSPELESQGHGKKLEKALAETIHLSSMHPQSLSAQYNELNFKIKNNMLILQELQNENLTAHQLSNIHQNYAKVNKSQRDSSFQINSRKKFMTSAILLNKMNAISKEGITSRLQSHKAQLKTSFSKRESPQPKRKNSQLSSKLRKKLANLKLRYPLVKRLKSWNTNSNSNEPQIILHKPNYQEFHDQNLKMKRQIQSRFPQAPDEHCDKLNLKLSKNHPIPKMKKDIMGDFTFLNELGNRKRQRSRINSSKLEDHSRNSDKELALFDKNNILSKSDIKLDSGLKMKVGKSKQVLSQKCPIDLIYENNPYLKHALELKLECQEQSKVQNNKIEEEQKSSQKKQNIEQLKEKQKELEAEVREQLKIQKEEIEKLKIKLEPPEKQPKKQPHPQPKNIYKERRKSKTAQTTAKKVNPKPNSGRLTERNTSRVSKRSIIKRDKSIKLVKKTKSKKEAPKMLKLTKSKSKLESQKKSTVFVEYTPLDMLLNFIYGLVVDTKSLIQHKRNSRFDRLSKKSKYKILLMEESFKFNVQDILSVGELQKYCSILNTNLLRGDLAPMVPKKRSKSKKS